MTLNNIDSLEDIEKVLKRLPLFQTLAVQFERVKNLQKEMHSLPWQKVKMPLLSEKYGGIHQYYAPQMNQFNLEFVSPYINFHHPCFTLKRSLMKRERSKNL